VARNTVVYRVKRAEELIGRHTGTLAVQLALEIMKYPGSLESAAQQSSQDLREPVRRMYVKPGLVP
jgi:hypothetical protein